MKPLRVSKDIVPIGRFKGEASQWLKKIAKSGQTLVITQNGTPAGVVMSPAEFDRIRARQRFLECIAAGVRDAEDGAKGSAVLLRDLRLDRRAVKAAVEHTAEPQLRELGQRGSQQPFELGEHHGDRASG